MVDLRYLQRRMMELYLERDKERGVLGTFAWLVEEIGELAEALIREDKNGIEEEIADVIAWTLSLANLLGVDAERSLCEKYGC